MIDKQIAREAKAIVALAVRNGPLEELHAGKLCPTCNNVQGYSHISEDEIKMIIKSAVNRVYSLLCLKGHDPESYDREIKFGSRYVTGWDEPG